MEETEESERHARGLTFPVTLVLMGINVLVFVVFAWQLQDVWMSDMRAFLSLLWSGSNFNPFTLDDEPWRIVTSAFMHQGILHLALNMYGLYAIGRPLEEALGGLRFALLYMLVAVCGSVCSLYFNLFVSSVGASGAVFGLFGYFVARSIIVYRHDREELSRIVVNFLVFAVVNYTISLSVNVDTPAHLGGLVAGALVAVLQLVEVRLRPAVLLALLLMATSVLWILPRNQLHYYTWWQQLLDVEDRAIQVSKLKIPDAQWADTLRSMHTVYDTLQAHLRQMPDIPEALHADTSILHRYIDLRQQEYRHWITLIDRESYIYLDSVEYVRQQFNDLPRFQYVLNYRAKAEAPASEEEAEPMLMPARVYYDSNWVETDSIHAVYYREGTRDSLARWSGRVRDYYRDGSLQMRGQYERGLENGIFIYYSNQHRYESAGRYAEEQPVGKWEYFHDNGRLHREVVYDERVFVRTVYDTAGTPQVVNGQGRHRTWYTNGQVKEEGNIINGHPEGVWRGYHENGSPYFEEYYVGGRLQSGISLDVRGNRYIYDETSLYPAPIMGEAAYARYLREQVRKPAEEVSGQVRLTLVVMENGGVRDVVVLKSLNPACDAEAVRLVTEGPAWRPARVHGQEPVTAKTVVTVHFD